MSIYINVSAYKLPSSLDIWDIHLFDVLNWDVANLPIPHWKMGSVFDFRTDLSLPSLFRDPSWCFGGISIQLFLKSKSFSEQKKRVTVDTMTIKAIRADYVYLVWKDS